MFAHFLVAISPEDAEKVALQNDALDNGETVVDPISVQILHAIALSQEPTPEMVESIYAELWTDEKYGLTDVEFILCTPPKNVVEQLLETITEMTNELVANNETLLPKRMLH